MLDLSYLKNDLKYNDDVDYTKFDDLYSNYKHNICQPTSNEQKYIDKILSITSDKKNFEISNVKVSHIKPDMKKYITSVKCKHITLHKNELYKYKNVLIDENDDDTDEIFNELQFKYYSGVRYYSNTDTIVIPKAIYNRIDNTDVLITIYGNDDIPNIDMKYIPNIINHTIVKNESFGIIKDDNNIFEDCIYVYKNLPRELFNIVSTDCETLSYNTNENIFYSHSKTNQFKLNLLCKDIAENGFYTPIQLMVMNDGTIIPYNSNKRFIIGVYLNAPSIPVCLLYNKSKFNNTNFHYIHTNKNINELTSPYIII